MQFDRLFSPTAIGGLTLKNRVVMSAMNTLYCQDGFASDRFNEFYWRRAEGGCGLIMVGGARIDEYGSGYGMADLSGDAFIPGFRKFTDGIHRRDARVGVQLFHAGRYALSGANYGNRPIAPSEVYSSYSKELPREMTVEEIQTVISQAARAARRAREAGFDLVELGASAGYLVCQFLSPLTNLRQDAYGGTWENRTRFARELVAAVRAAVGPDYPLSMRISGHDLVPGSNDNQAAVGFARCMEQAGVDMLNVTGGWHESRVPQITGALPRGGFAYLAGAVKAAVGIPVAASNRINTPATAERILLSGQADLVSVGRPQIADPDWCRKAAADREELIRGCVACNQGCLGRVFFHQPAECMINGQAGREYRLPRETRAAAPMKILVAGGGPTGCEFAIRAAEQGHRVSLWEKDARLGGQLRMAWMPPDKGELRSLLQYYENTLSALGVAVTCNKTAEPEEMIAGGFDLVVTAIGRGKAPEIPLDNPGKLPVCSAYDILRGERLAGKNVLVIGGGTVGCETAEYIAAEAAPSPEQVYHMLCHGYEPPERVRQLMDCCWRSVTIVDIKKIGQGFEPGTAWPVLQNLKRLGVARRPFTRVTALENGVAVLRCEGEGAAEPTTVTIPCDTVVLAVGAALNDGLYRQLRAAGVNAVNIGDAQKLGNILSGVRQACETAEALRA